MDATTPTAEQLRVAFGLQHLDTHSIYPYAPVRRGRTTDGRHVVVKRAGAHPDRVEGVATWVRDLSARGIGVVAPLPLDRANPQRVGDDFWVAYPFIDGHVYQGSSRQLAEAGELLGRIHAAALRPEGMRRYEFTDATYEQSAQEVDEVGAILRRHLGEGSDAAREHVGGALDRWWRDALPTLRDAHARGDLVEVGVSSDYRASNLLYAAHGPVLVDPDNGGIEPRLFDLALALVLFPMNVPTAPGRMLTPREWEVFAAGYLGQVDLTVRERELWPLALLHLYWEEGTWQLSDQDEREWRDPVQGGYLRGLAGFAWEDYPLPE